MPSRRWQKILSMKRRFIIRFTTFNVQIHTAHTGVYKFPHRARPLFLQNNTSPLVLVLLYMFNNQNSQSKNESWFKSLLDTTRNICLLARRLQFTSFPPRVLRPIQEVMSVDCHQLWKDVSLVFHQLDQMWHDCRIYVRYFEYLQCGRKPSNKWQLDRIWIASQPAQTPRSRSVLMSISSRT